MKISAITLSAIASVMFYALTIWSATQAASQMLAAFGMLAAVSFIAACIFAGISIMIAYEG